MAKEHAYEKTSVVDDLVVGIIIIIIIALILYFLIESGYIKFQMMGNFRIV